MLCIIVFLAVFATWSEIYSYSRLNVPQKSNGEQDIFIQLLQIAIQHFSFRHSSFVAFSNQVLYRASAKNAYSINSKNNISDKGEEIVTQPSKFGNFIYSIDHEKHSKQESKKLICYYTTPRNTVSVTAKRSYLKKSESSLRIRDINPHLCTHLNIGIIEISNCTLVIDDDLISAFKESNSLKGKNENLKVMLWVGGADESTGFSEMVENHVNRKRFIQSLKETLKKYSSTESVSKFASMNKFPFLLFKFYSFSSLRSRLGISKRIKLAENTFHATIA